ncbi:origin of replication complex subunit 6-like [Juglans regia]|uniref:Origin of replication complex subunit 6-like n=1 Tax=Juglans regia TaxID=51240 RepID=A0A6P9EZ97_JUGRE|nr:origin of replication complex subunit 6-like [Juglans regia]
MCEAHSFCEKGLIYLKVDKLKLIELCGASEPEFSNVSTSKKNLCHYVSGVAKEKKDARDIKGNRGMSLKWRWQN